MDLITDIYHFPVLIQVSVKMLKSIKKGDKLHRKLKGNGPEIMSFKLQEFLSMCQ